MPQEEVIDYLILVYLFLSSFIGTTCMTIFMYIYGSALNKNTAVVHILGTMVTFSNRNGRNSTSFLPIAIGSIIHYIVGFIYVAVYHLLWVNGIGRPEFFDGFFFGAISGIIAMGGWFLFIKIHPNHPYIPLKSFMLALFLAHIIFSLASLYTYLFLFRYPLPLDQSLN